MSTIDDIKSRVDIVDLVGEFVPLKRSGRSYRAPCPFHSERTPSFFVSPERQTWHCFGACATGGDIFTFVMRRENVEFAEALRILAQRAGVQLGEARRPEEDERYQRLIQANDAAAAYYHGLLLTSKAAEGARAYLAGRGLDAETVESFQLGYSPDAWDALKSHLTERGFTDMELLSAGLLVEGERGGYDRFRGRLMFPIRDDRGRAAGFGARELEPAAGQGPGAKYINTPKTPLFDKSSLLYGLDKAKAAARKERRVIVVEGYMDVIAAHQHGVTNAVASMGTALTDQQIRALERLRATILLALDADAAGIEATLRALQEAGAAGAVRAVASSAHPDDLPDEQFKEQAREWSRDGLKRAAVTFYVVPLSGKDPDEMIRRDRAAWDEALANARPFTDHVFDLVASRKDLAQPAGRAELLRELLPVVRLIEEPVYHAHYVQRLARLALVDEDTIRGELRRARAPRRGLVAEAPAARLLREPAEEFCLALLLRNGALRHEGEALRAEVFVLGEHRAIFEAWRATPNLDALRAALPDDVLPRLNALLELDLPIFEGAKLNEALQDCVAKIERDRLRQAMLASAAALAEPDAQEHMKAAVEEAFSRQANQTGNMVPSSPSPPADERVAELAVRLVEDDELGRRLHQAALRRASEERTAASPQSEGQT
ncbi:MAG: DNA primase [Chloroflexi bacterium]|nr:DNA primase [Chloroflexota bacterium]